MKNFLLGVMAAVLCLGAGYGTYQAVRSEDYEYKFGTFNKHISSKALSAYAARDNGGWRLKAVSEDHGGFTVFFEREKR